ncbi:MAG: poly-beta-1,6-N-acetyl-D-glucosamine biosynthesis protein PgaD [Methylomonas sp.]
MKDIIINQPHLQSFKQKCGSVFLSLASWLLWLYFLLPLFTLGGWLLGVKNLSDEIRWFGGYKTLLDLLLLYGEIILVIAAGWLVWTLYLSWLHAGWPPKLVPEVTDQQLSEAFKINNEQLVKAKASNKMTVHFDEHALITSIDCNSSCRAVGIDFSGIGVTLE